MRLFKEKLPMNTKCCYAITAWMTTERKDNMSGELAEEESFDQTIEVDSPLDAALIMIAIDYMAEKKLEITHLIERSGYYFINKFGKLFNVSFECEEPECDPNEYTFLGNCWFDGYRTVKFEYGKEMYEITLDKNDPFVSKVRSICDRIMKQYWSIDECDTKGYWSYDIVEQLKPEAEKLMSESIEVVKK